MNITKTANSITIELDETERKILLNDLLDWQQWIEDAITNKLANCKSRLIKNGTEQLISTKSVETIPTDETALLDLIFNQMGYKNRVERDMEEEKLLQLR
jgi:hypothetical protein